MWHFLLTCYMLGAQLIKCANYYFLFSTMHNILKHMIMLDYAIRTS